MCGWGRLVACWPAEVYGIGHGTERGTRNAERGPWPWRPWYALSAEQGMPAPVKALVMPCSRAALVSCTAAWGRAAEACSSRPKGSCDDLYVHRVLLVVA